MRPTRLFCSVWRWPATLAHVAPAAAAGDLVWEVENPFRLFRKPAAFALHERAFSAVKGTGRLPADIVWRTERRLNDPDCADPSTPAACEASARARYETSRLGWAAQVFEDTCYDRDVRPRRYGQACERQYSWGTAKESLRPARGAHRAGAPVAGAPRRGQFCRGQGRVHLDVAAAPPRRPGRNPPAGLRGTAGDRAGALFAQHRGVGRVGVGDAADRAGARRSRAWWSRTC